MNDHEQAHHELDRIQGIIARHEGHIFRLRGWLFAALAGTLAAYYSHHIGTGVAAFVVMEALLVLAFIYLELRHVILIDAVVGRAGKIEELLAVNVHNKSGWYEGPRINAVCGRATRLVPAWRGKKSDMGMTFRLNLVFYVALLGFTVFLIWALPSRT